MKGGNDLHHSRPSRHDKSSDYPVTRERVDCLVPDRSRLKQMADLPRFEFHSETTDQMRNIFQEAGLEVLLKSPELWNSVNIEKPPFRAAIPKARTPTVGWFKGHRVCVYGVNKE